MKIVATAEDFRLAAYYRNNLNNGASYTCLVNQAVKRTLEDAVPNRISVGTEYVEVNMDNSYNNPSWLTYKLDVTGKHLVNLFDAGVTEADFHFPVEFEMTPIKLDW